MRAVAALSLIGLLMLCPLICGAEEIAHAARLHGAMSSPTGDSPSHCPEDTDNCICQGAVQLEDARTQAENPDAIGLSLLLDFAFPTPGHPIAHLTWNGSPTGLAGWGDATMVRSFLQNFRC